MAPLKRLVMRINELRKVSNHFNANGFYANAWMMIRLFFKVIIRVVCLFHAGEERRLWYTQSCKYPHFLSCIWFKVVRKMKSSDKHNPSPSALSSGDKACAELWMLVFVWESRVDAYTSVSLLTVSAACRLYIYIWLAHSFSLIDKPTAGETLPLSS